MGNNNVLNVDASVDKIGLNEEELRSKVLLPYLQALNIPPSNIALEQTFSVRLGHTVLDSKGREKQKISGRLDVLVKDSDGQNLFIVELKAPHVELSDDDVNQGISYARLLDQIAPFVVVTNGITSRVYDTITKQEIKEMRLNESDFWINSRQLSTQEDLNIRFEAMQYFLGYSTENLQSFCVAQRERAMSALKGQQSNRKYNPKTYVKRSDVRVAIDSFIKSNSTAFVILGESGVGKTNEICSFAEELGNDHLVLFVNATEISESVDKTLSREFNWGFSENIVFSEIVRRLTRLGNLLNKRILLFIDSLDEAEATNIERSISELVSNISSSNGVIKLIVSIKMADWSRFSTFSGTPSKLHLLLDKSWYCTDKDSSSDPRPFVLTTFSDSEKSEAIEAYSKFYNLLPFPSGTVRNYCNHPFLLRVVSELYCDGRNIPSDISEELLIETWIQRKLQNTDNSDFYRFALVKLAQAIYEESIDKAQLRVTYRELESASIDTVIKGTNTLDAVGIFNKLESLGFTIVQKDYKGVSHYSFYYGPVRDYFIARHILKLDKMSDDTMLKQLPCCLENSILRSSLFWHLRRAPSSHIHAVKSLISARANEFITTYNQILDFIFPELKHCLPPYTSQEIGVCYRSSGEWLEYGVYPVMEYKRKNVVELQYSMNDSGSYKELSNLGAERFMGGGTNFLNEDPKKSAAKYALEVINEAINKGNLNESHIETILQEGVLAIISTNDFLHANCRLNRNANSQLPLNLDELYKEVQIAFGRSKYERTWIDECVQEQRSINPGQNGFSIPTMPRERRQKFEKELVVLVDNGEIFSAPNMHGNDDLKVISDLIIQLSAHKKILNEQLLPEPDLSSTADYRNEFSNYSRERLIEYIEKYYVKSIESYISLVRLNFSGLVHKLKFINNLPNEIFVEVNRNNPNAWSLRYAFTKCEENNLVVTVKVDPEKPLFSYEDGSLMVDGVKRDYFFSGGTTLSYMFKPYQGPAYNAEQASFVSAMPVRSFAYSKIKDDFKQITAEDLLVELDLAQSKQSLNC